MREILDNARNRVARTVNSEMVRAYWQIGQVIVEHEQAGEERAEYGARLIEELAARLKVDGMKGFSKNNLWYMRQFYLAFPEKLHALRGELSWKLTHQDLGQMQFYTNYYTREIREEWENPAIGILLCADKNEAVVRYTLPENQDQVFAARYRLQLPSEEELAAELTNELRRERQMLEA